MNSIEMEQMYGFDEEAVKVIREQFNKVDSEMHALESLLQKESCSQEAWFYADILDKLRNTIRSIDYKFQMMENKLKEQRFLEQYKEE